MARPKGSLPRLPRLDVEELARSLGQLPTIPEALARLTIADRPDEFSLLGGLALTLDQLAPMREVVAHFGRGAELIRALADLPALPMSMEGDDGFF